MPRCEAVLLTSWLDAASSKAVWRHSDTVISTVFCGMFCVTTEFWARGGTHVVVCVCVRVCVCVCVAMTEKIKGQRARKRVVAAVWPPAFVVSTPSHVQHAPTSRPSCHCHMTIVVASSSLTHYYCDAKKDEHNSQQRLNTCDGDDVVASVQYLSSFITALVITW
jgi:hypothetical protein